ncbi:MAG: ankyrin repeat domain-containing protein [Alphaproteobacteria bacterium]|nr:ankyrin repeat domain-containing protein [Alphaproteobacteria bacterium]
MLAPLAAILPHLDPNVPVKVRVPSCEECGAPLGAAELEPRISPGGPLFHPALRWPFRTRYSDTTEALEACLLSGNAVALRNLLLAAGETLFGIEDARILHHIAALRDPKLLQAALECGVSHASRDMRGDTVLVGLARQGDLDSAIWMLQAMGPTRFRAAELAEAIAVAGADGHAPLVSALVGYARSVGMVLNDLRLHIPADRGHLEVVEALIDLGVPIDACDLRGRTALHHAARRGHVRVVAALLDAGAQLDPPDTNGLTPLELAERARCDDVVDLLLARGSAVSPRPRPQVTARGAGRFTWSLLDPAPTGPSA